MTLITKRSLRLFNYALDNNLAGTTGELCKRIGLVPSNLAAIKNGERSFTHDQLYQLASLTKADMNWIYGFSQTMFRTDKPLPPIVKIKQAIAEMEAGAKGKSKVSTRSHSR